jgi:hypothetical protein
VCVCVRVCGCVQVSEDAKFLKAKQRK